MPGLWSKLVSMAEEELQRTQQRLPPALCSPASNLPVIFEEQPDSDLQQGGIASDTLGLFVGEAHHDVGMSTQPSANSIHLFLRNIWEEADQDATRYREEVRKTYLHELGHYLGLDEDELEGRGLQ